MTSRLAAWDRTSRQGWSPPSQRTGAAGWPYAEQAGRTRRPGSRAGPGRADRSPAEAGHSRARRCRPGRPGRAAPGFRNRTRRPPGPRIRAGRTQAGPEQAPPSPGPAPPGPLVRWEGPARGRRNEGGRGRVTEQAPWIAGGEHQEVAGDPDVVPHGSRERLVQRPRHPARDEHDQPGHKHDQEAQAVAQDRYDDGGGDDQDDPEQDGEPVERARLRPELDRVVGLSQLERRVHVRKQEQVRGKTGQPAQVADLEVGQPGGQAAGEQRGEPADQRHHLGGDAEHVQHDQVRYRQDDPHQDGEPALLGRLREGQQDLVRGARLTAVAGWTVRHSRFIPGRCGNPRGLHRYFSH